MDIGRGMKKNFLNFINTALRLTLALTLVVGFLYPGIIALVAHLFFPWQATGSLLLQGDKRVGSALIGQSFTEDRYFWGRLSATTPYPYNVSSSSGSSLGPTNPLRLKRAEDRLKALSQHQKAPIPLELVTASGSGLDPDMSPQSAFYQTERVAKARHLDPRQVQKLIQDHIQAPQWGFLGEPRVNVLKLNRALDQLSQGDKK
jgi:K+-transporting ATPase ATPase C chain